MTLRLLYPHTPARQAWDLLILLLATASALVVPFTFTFGLRTPGLFYAVIVAVFILDIAVSFNTPYSRGYALVDEKGRVVRAYLKGWFALDLLAALPLAVLAGETTTHTLLRAIVYMLPSIKVLKVLTHLRAFERTGSIPPAIFRLIKFLYLVVIAVHWMALGWVGIGASPAADTLFRRYLLALYWTVTTVATIGFGDITPALTSNRQLLYTLAVELVGVGVFGFVIGNLASLIANLDLAGVERSKKMEELTAFFKQKKIPPPLQKKMRDYYHYLYETKGSIGGDTPADILPESLKTEVSLFLNREILQKVPIFADADEIFIREIVRLTEPLVFLPGDDVVRAGEYGDAMYFISSGRVEVTNPDGRELAVLEAGSFFGEMSLIHGQTRVATVRCLEYCDVYRLSKENFDKLLAKYPAFHEHVKATAFNRNGGGP